MSVSSCSLSVIGDGSVGKSTIIKAFRAEGFAPVYKQTVGCEFYEKQLQIRGEQMVSLRVWDIGGQSIHSKNLESFIGHSSAILLVYDITNAESFRNLDDWLALIKKYTKTKYIYLTGNKIDLISLRQVPLKQHEQFISDNELAGSIFVSAKTGDNVVKSFYRIAGDAIGIKLTEYELAFHDKVVTAHVDKNSDRYETRNEWADDIEKEDLAAEANKNKHDGCNCILS